MFDYFGIGITAADRIIDVMYELTLANQQKEYYLPQVDFLRVAMGDKLIAIDVNMELDPLLAGENEFYAQLSELVSSKTSDNTLLGYSVISVKFLHTSKAPRTSRDIRFTVLNAPQVSMCRGLQML